MSFISKLPDRYDFTIGITLGILLTVFGSWLQAKRSFEFDKKRIQWEYKLGLLEELVIINQDHLVLKRLEFDRLALNKAWREVNSLLYRVNFVFSNRDIKLNLAVISNSLLDLEPVISRGTTKRDKGLIDELINNIRSHIKITERLMVRELDIPFHGIIG